MCTSVYRICIKTGGKKASVINFIKLFGGYFWNLLSPFPDYMAVWFVLQAADALILFVMLLVKQAVCIFCKQKSLQEMQTACVTVMLFNSYLSTPVGVTL